MAFDPVRVGCIGMGWWSDVLADAAGRSGKFRIVACYTRSEAKRDAFASKYDCRAAPSYEALLADRTIEAVINTTPNNVHRETTCSRRCVPGFAMPAGARFRSGIPARKCG